MRASSVLHRVHLKTSWALCRGSMVRNRGSRCVVVILKIKRTKTCSLLYDCYVIIHLQSHTSKVGEGQTVRV